MKMIVSAITGPSSYWWFPIQEIELLKGTTMAMDKYVAKDLVALLEDTSRGFPHEIYSAAESVHTQAQREREGRSRNVHMSACL